MGTREERRADPGRADAPPDIGRRRQGVEIAPGVDSTRALEPSLRIFDIILRTANGTTYEEPDRLLPELLRQYGANSRGRLCRCQGENPAREHGQPP
jgi:hypothetical protein